MQSHNLFVMPWASFQMGKIAGAHAPGMLGTFSQPPRVSDPVMHHGTCVTHAPWCMPGSLSSGFLLSRWRGKRSRHSRCMRNPHFYVYGKRPMEATTLNGKVTAIKTQISVLVHQAMETIAAIDLYSYPPAFTCAPLISNLRMIYKCK